MNRLFRPVEYGDLPLLGMRLAFAAVVWISFPAATSYAGQPEPVGIAHLADLTFLSDPGAMKICRMILGGALLWYVIGIAPAITLLVAFGVHILPGTLVNSQGGASATHHLQPVSLALLGQWIYAVYFAAKGGGFSVFKRVPFGDRALAQGMVFAAVQALMASYVVSAITKLSASGLGWIADAKYYPLQILKAQRSDFFNALGEPTGGSIGLFGGVAGALERAIFASPVLAQITVGAGLFLELFAFLALLGRRWALAVGALLAGFHLIVSEMMNLNFKYNILMLLALMVVPNLLPARWALVRPAAAADGADGEREGAP